MNSLGQNTGVGSLSLLQGVFPTQRSNPGLPHCRWILYQLRHKGSPRILEWVAYPLHLPDPGIELGSPALLEKAMAPYSSTLAWKIPWMEEPGRLQSMGLLTERLHFHFSLSCIGEGNGNPLQCSCLENPRDGEAWWAAIYGVTQSWTRLK